MGFDKEVMDKTVEKSGKEQGLCSQVACFQILALPSTSWVALVKLVKHSVLPVPRPRKLDGNSAYVPAWL